MTVAEPEYMTTEEFGALTRRTPEAVRQDRYRGNGPQGYKVGRRVLFKRSEVLAWIDAQARVESVPQAS